MFYKILFFLLCAMIIVYYINNTYENFQSEDLIIGKKEVKSTQKEYNMDKSNNILKNIIWNKEYKDETLNYNNILIDESKDLTYYNNDILDQSKIYENADDVINQRDKIDYSNITTGMDKCTKSCDGTCFELGYTGTATCFPKMNTFDYGTLYKNPQFTYGLKDYNKYV